MMKKRLIIVAIFLLTLLSSCALLDDVIDILAEDDHELNVTLIEDLQHIDYFRDGALEHILEGELNRKGQAVGFHYDNLPTKKGEIVSGTETDPNDYGVYEAKVTVNEIEKTSNRGLSTFFPDEWDTQEVIDAINEAYDNRTFVTGNTYEGLTEEGVIVHMYLDNNDKIISAFPIY